MFLQYCVNKPQDSPHLLLPGWTNSPISPSTYQQRHLKVFLLQESDLQLGKFKRAL